ncbi:MAG: shikimate dehydrogenase, partial [Pirellulales bacterium]
KVYVPFRVAREDLANFLDDCQELGIRGLSVTIPHKEAVFQALSRPDEATKNIGATNTLVFEGRERAGYNTDYQAAIASLKKSHGSLRNQSAMVLGAGGAALAVAYGLKQEGARVTISSRTLARAERLAEQVKCRAVDWEQRHSFSVDILVNCTPVGMHPQVAESPFDKHRLKPGMVVFDTVYNPETTLLIKEARNRNCTVVTGVDMFIGQAALQYKLFTGQAAPEELMRETLKRAIGPAKG